MNYEETIKTFDVTSEKPFVFKAPRVAKNKTEAIFMKVGLLSKTRKIIVKPITLGGRERYSSYALNYTLDDVMSLVSKTRADVMVSAEKMDSIVMSIASAIHNKKSFPPKWLIETVEQFTNKELSEFAAMLFEMLNTDSFLSSIISLTGMSLKPEEIIATEKESKTHGK